MIDSGTPVRAATRLEDEQAEAEETVVYEVPELLQNRRLLLIHVAQSRR